MSDLVQALLAAGMAANHAQRVASAVRQVAAESQKSSFTARPSSSSFQAPASDKAFALYASGPAAYIKSSNSFGAGKAALGVDGLAIISGQLALNGQAYVGTLDVEGGVAAKDVIADNVAAERLAVRRSVDISDSKAVFSVPLTSERRFVSQAGGQFSGDNIFDGPITIANNVNWNGPRDPAAVEIPARIISGPNGSLRVTTRSVAVLNDYGAAKPYGITASLTATSADATIGGTVSLLGTTLTVLTGATFDPDSCAISAATASIFHCTGATFTPSGGSGGPFLLANPMPQVSLNVG